MSVIVNTLPNTLPDEKRYQAIAKVSRDSFWKFVKFFWDSVPGSQPLQENWHMKYVCDELQVMAERVFRGEDKLYDLLINISPGTSKSTLVSILFPCWNWTRMPSARHITASHTDMLVLDLSTKARCVIESELYQACFPEIVLRDDQGAKGYYANTLGGDRVSCTVGGKSPMGFHAHFLLLDDPTDPQRALSQAELKNASEFATNVLFTRKVDKRTSVFVGVMQRLHVNDPTGYLLEKAKTEGTDPIRHVCLPAEEADNINPPELRKFYKDGLMDPIRLSHKALRSFKNNAYTYAGQFLQQPYMIGGGMFLQEYFNRRVKAGPFNATRVRFWDRASSGPDSPGACFTAGVLMSKSPEGNFCVEHMVHGQWEPDDRNKKILATALADRARYGLQGEPTIFIEAEGGSSGRDAWKAIARVLAGFPVREERVTGSKDTRAEPWSCQLASGNVSFVENGTYDLQRLIEEHLMFKPEPGKRLGRYKDIVDSCSGSFNILSGIKNVQMMRTFSFRRQKKTEFKVMVLTREELISTTLEEFNCFLLCVNDPEPLGNNEIPQHGIHNLVGTLLIKFADVEPEKNQEGWDTAIEPYGKPCKDVMFSIENGKKIWSSITNKRIIPPNVVVVCDDNTNRGLALAYGVVDTLRLSRKDVIFCPSSTDNHGEGSPNEHITKTMKSTRALVL